MGIDFGVNIDRGQITNLTELKSVLKSMGATIVQITGHMQKFNDAAQLQQEAIKAIVKESRTGKGIGEELSIMFNANKSGGFDQIVNRMRTNAEQNLRTRRKFTDKIIANIRDMTKSSMPTGALTDNVKDKIDTMAAQVGNIFNKSSLRLKEFRTLIKEVFAGTRHDFSTLNAEQIKVVQAARGLYNISKTGTTKQSTSTANTQRIVDSEEIRREIDRQFSAVITGRLPGGMTDAILKKKDVVSEAISKLFTSSSTPLASFQGMLSGSMAARPGTFVGMPDEQRTIILQMLDLKNMVLNTTKKQEDAINREAAAVRLRNKLETEFSKFIKSDVSADERLKKTLQMERSINQLVKAIKTGKIDITDFNKILTDMLSGTKAAGMSSLLEDMFTKLSTLKNNLGADTATTRRNRKNDSALMRDNLISGIRTTLQQDLISLIPKDIDRKSADFAKKIDQVKISVQSLITPLINGKISILDFTKAYNGFKSGVSPLSDASNEIVKLDNKLVKLRNTISSSPSGGVSSAKGIIDWLVSPSGLTRLGVLQLAHKLVGGLISQIQKYADQTVEFERTVTRIRTITTDLNFSPGEWKTRLMNISNKTGTDLNEVAKAANELFSNTLVKGEEGLPILEKALRFSKVSGATATEAINLVTFTLNTFKMSIDETDSVLATFFKTIDLGNVKASDLAATIGMVGPLAKQMSISVEDLSAAFVTLTSHGISTEQAGTLLRNVIKEMISPTEKLKELFKEWNVETGKQAIQVYGLAGVLTKLSRELQDKGPERIAELVDDLRSLVAIPALADGNNLKRFTDTLDEMRKRGAEDAAKANQMVGESTSLGFDRLIAGIKNKFVMISDPLFNAINKILDMPNMKNLEVIFDRLLETLGKSLETAINFIPVIDQLVNRFSRWIGIDFSNFDEHFEVLRLTFVEMNKTLDRWEKFVSGTDPALRREQEYNTAKKEQVLLIQQMEKLQKNLLKDTEQFGKENGNILTNLKNISGIEASTIEKFTEAQTKHIEKVREKTKNVIEDIKNAFAARELTGKTAGDTLFDRIVKAGPVIANLYKEAQQYFNERNLDRAREKFDTIQRIVEKINDELKGSISDSIKRISDISTKMDQTLFEQKLRGKSASSKTTLVTNKVNELIGQALNTQDINNARELLTEAERLANTIYDKDKKTKGDQLINQVRQAQIQREQQNIQFANQNMINENALLNTRIQFENNILNMEEQIVKLSQIEIKNNQMKLDQRRREIDLISEQIDKIKTLIRMQEGKIINNAPLDGEGVLAPGRANGGFGVDNNLTRVGGNELIMNANASRQWTTTLMAMNAGLPIRNSRSTVNVGDININYTSSNSTETDVRRLAEGIRREIRRGTVRLS